MDQLYLYLEHDAFRMEKCKTPTKGIVCGADNDKLVLYAETDGPDGFILFIKERFEENQPFRLHLLQVRFTHRDGMILSDVTDFYEDYPRRIKGAQTQLVVRRWLQDIQKAINPTFPFPPLK
ncbi:MAG: hypothetical protein RRB13_14700 [bacterium]|nr:hypothetical protein [bacterium]